MKEDKRELHVFNLNCVHEFENINSTIVFDNSLWVGTGRNSRRTFWTRTELASSGYAKTWSRWTPLHEPFWDKTFIQIIYIFQLIKQQFYALRFLLGEKIDQKSERENVRE